MTYDYKTSNKSFIEMYRTLKDLGIKNNKFHLILYDNDLLGVDPYDPNLSLEIQMKIYKECMINFWYFIREIIRIPSPGGLVQYRLHRGNLACHYLQLMNQNLIEVLPRQHYKTYSAVCFYAWIYLFVAKNYTILFSNKQLDDSQLNIKRLNDLFNDMPDYLKGHFDTKYDTNNINMIRLNANNNMIKSVSTARDKASADKLGRGLTSALLWFDEFAFLSWNDVTFKSARPALSTAAEFAKKAGTPYGITITTTPNNLDDPSGKFCYDMIQKACNFEEQWYDWEQDRVLSYIEANSSNNFVYVEFSYTDLGRDDKWLKQQIKELGGDMLIVKRELLIQWTYASNTSPFSEEQLSTVEEFIKDIYQKIIIKVNNVEYPVYFIERLENMYDKNWIMGLDISGGLGRDYSTFTVIDPLTRRPKIIFFNNLISLNNFSDLVIEFVNKYIPNAVLVPERNNAGIAVIENLMKSNISKNLYYEDNKDSTIEVVDREKSIFKPTKVKKEKRIYGMTTGSNRNYMIEILYNIINEHPELINNKFLFDEIKALTRKSNGKIEHQIGMHDDILFSFLIAEYTLLYGKNINRFIKNVSSTPKDSNEVSKVGLKLNEFRRYNKNEADFDDSLTDKILKENFYDKDNSAAVSVSYNSKASKIKSIFDMNKL